MRLLLLGLLALAACQTGAPGPITETGALEDDDLQLTSGELYDGFEVQAREGQWIRVAVVADGFDPYLIVRSPTEQQSEVDDSDEGDTRRTELAVRATESGRWTALVTSFAPGSTGTYSVTIEVTDEAPAGLDDGRGPTIEV